MAYDFPTTYPVLSTPRRGAAALVAAGILASRIFGLVRQRVIAHFFGQSTDAADAFFAAFRIPNFLQNLFGEGVLSAAMIPEYTRLVAAGKIDEARKLAGAIAGLLGALVLVVVAVGVSAAPLLVDVIVPGFEGARRELAITLVRIAFPGCGGLVLSAWCLAILNSHRRFLLAYSAPVVWNIAIIVATLMPRGPLAPEHLVVWTAWGAVVGSVLQIAVQLPLVLSLMGGVRLSLDVTQTQVRTVLKNFVPVFFSRGVVQISAFIDAMIASLLPVGAVAVISNAQMLYLLPVSLFGMSVAAAELPAMSESVGVDANRLEALRARVASASSRIAYFIVPSSVAFLTLGHLIAGLVLQSGAFSQRDSYWVWATLAGSTVGLLANSVGRLLTSTYYALSDTRTPLRFAALRVAIALALGYVTAVHGPRLFGIDARWGTAGLTASSGLAGWLEFVLLRRGLTRRIGAFNMPRGMLPRLWGAALCAAALAWALHVVLAPHAQHGILRSAEAALVLAGFAAAYGMATLALGDPMARELWGRVRRRP